MSTQVPRGQKWAVLWLAIIVVTLAPSVSADDHPNATPRLHRVGLFSSKDPKSPGTAPKSFALLAVEELPDNKPSEHEAAAATTAVESPDPVTPSGSSDGPPYTEAEYKALSDLIETKPLAEMDLKFLKDVYGRPHAPDMLKTIMGRAGMEQKNRRLGNLRKWYDWFENQAKFARDNHVIIENTNQGKDNGARSDLDATANILEFDWATGKWVIREKSVSELIRHQHKVYQDSQLTPDGLDVTIFNGDTWLPDWRDSRMSYAEFTQKLISNTYDLKNRKGAYFVPGAHKEQAHDRALAEGHSVHIAWDYIKDMPTVNGHLVEFDYQKGEIVDAETKEPIQEYVTREMAEMGVIRRYENVRALEKPEAWRRALGNVIQNTKEFLGHDEPISRNKYFIERGVDQASGRFVGSSAVEALGSMTSLRENTYVSIHGSNIDGQVKEAWKKAFIQQAFGLADSQGERIAQIQSVLDRSSEIQLDKTKKWHDGRGADYTQRRAEYYAGEMAEAKQNIAKQRDAIQQLHDAKNKQLLAQEKPPLAEIDWNERTLKEAERIFVEKQREIMIDGGVRVVEETLRRDFSAEGARLNRDKFKDPSTAKKIMAERGVEIALLFDMIETAPRLTTQERTALRERAIGAMPTEARSLVSKLAKISELKMGLLGRINFEEWGVAGIDKNDIKPKELGADIEAEMNRILGEAASKTSPIQESEVRDWILETIREHLGPEEQKTFNAAREAGQEGLIRKFGKTAYWNEITNSVDFLFVTGAALGMMNAYRMHCANQTSAISEECISGMAWETGEQVLYVLPGFNTGLITFSGLKAINEGNPEGFITLGLGTASLPSVARAMGVGGALFIKIYIAYQLAKAGYALTVGYCLQEMEDDAVEQAFKSLPEPGKPFARRYDGTSPRGYLNRSDTPVRPLLADLVSVPADKWEDQKRYDEAKQLFAPSIQAQLQESGLKPDTDEWYTKKVQIAHSYADALPYKQRMDKLLEVFEPKVKSIVDYMRANGQRDAGEDFIAMKVCIDRTDEEIDKKYKSPPTWTDWFRFWGNVEKDRQDGLNKAWSECTRRGAEANRAVLAPVFNKYVDAWAKEQNGHYDDSKVQARLVNALINEYVVRSYLNQGFEEERMAKKAAQRAGELKEAKLRIAGSLMQAREESSRNAQQTLEQAAETHYQGDPPEEPAAKPELRLKGPSYAVRLGGEAPIDFEVRGEYYLENQPDGAQRNQWMPVRTSEIINVAFERPHNLVMTQQLEDELKQGPGEPPRRFVTVDEKVTGELRDGAGNKMAQAETVVHYYDVLPKWKGEIYVSVQGAGPSTNVSTGNYAYAYSGAMVRVAGAAQAEKESEYQDPGNQGKSRASAFFNGLPAGTFNIHVEPKPGDNEHRAADAALTLKDFEFAKEDQDDTGQVLALTRYNTIENGTPVGNPTDIFLVRWKDTTYATIVLPYVPPPVKVTSSQPPEPPSTQTHQPPNQGGDGNSTKKPPDPQVVKECQDLVAQAQQSLTAGDTAAAEQGLNTAKQKDCGALDPSIDQGIKNAQNQVDTNIKNAAGAVKNGLDPGNCDFVGAWAQAQQLQKINPSDPALAGLDLNQLAAQAQAQTAARALLSQGKDALLSNDTNGAIASLGSALAIPNLPECMRKQIQDLKGELDGRLAFTNLTQQVELASLSCDYDKAKQLIDQVTNLQPRTQAIDDWLNTSVVRLNDLMSRKKQALDLINAAQSLIAQANTLASTQPVDWNNVNSKLDEASKALDQAEQVAPQCLPERQKIPDLRQAILDGPVPGFVKNTTSGLPAPSDNPPPVVENTTPGNEPPSDNVPAVVDNTGQAQKPQKKPSNLATLGQVIDAIGRGISQTQPPPQSPPDNGGGGQTGGGPPPGGLGRGPTGPPRGPTSGGNPPNYPTKPTSTAGVARIKVFTSVECCTRCGTDPLGGITVTFTQGGRPVATVKSDSSAVAHVQIPAGTYVITGSYPNLYFIIVNLRLTPAPGTSIGVSTLGGGISVNLPGQGTVPQGLAEYELLVVMSGDAGPVCNAHFGRR